MRYHPQTGAARIGLLAVLAIASATTAQAVPVAPTGSFSGALTGGTVATTFTPGEWQLGVTTTQIQVTDGTRFISGAADPYLGIQNNLLASHGGPVTAGDAFTISTPVYNIFSGTLPSPFTVDFDGLTVTLTSEVVTSLKDGNIGLAFVGTLTGAPSAYLIGQSADFSIGFTQSGPTSAIGVAYSIDTPINPTVAALVPEPASMAIFGLGLAGIAGTRRKSRI